MNELETRSKLYLHFYGFLLSSTGWFMGYGIAMFNTFFDQFIRVVYNIQDKEQKIAVQGNLSFFFLLGGLLCCMTCSKVYENLGRYRTIVIFQGLSIFCILMELIQNLYLLYVFRILHGYLSCSYTIVSILIMTENLPKKISKIWNSSFYIFLTGGILTSYLFSSENAAHQWRLVFALPLVFDIPRFLLLLFVYRMESPLWLYNEHLDNEQIEYLMIENYRYIYPRVNAEIKTKQIFDEQLKIQKLEHRHSKLEQTSLLSTSYRKQFLLILYLNFLNQMTGINFLIFYSTEIYKELNLSAAESLTFYMGFVNFLSGFAILIIVKLMDLRDILAYGLLAQCISYFVFLIGYTFQHGIIAVVGSYLYIFSFGCSMGGSLYPYQTMVLPARGVGIASISQWFMACLVGKYALVVVQTFGIYYTFYFFMLMSFIGAIITAGFGVKIGNKSQYEIEKEFIEKKFFKKQLIDN